MPAGRGAQVRTTDAGTVATERGDIEYVRSRDQQQAWEQQIDRYRNPRLTDLWTGFVDLGASLSRGNARTSTLATAASASRSTNRDRIV